MLAPHFIENIFRSRLTLISSWDGFCHEDQWNVFDKTFLQNVLQYYWNEKRTYHVFKWWQIIDNWRFFYSFSLSSILMFSILAMQIFIFVLFMSPYCVESIDADYIQYLFCVLLGITCRIQGNTREQIIWPGGGGSYSLLHFSINLFPSIFYTSLGTNVAQVTP